MITAEYGRDFWKRFKELSDRRFRELIAEFPDIGESMFALNYAYAPGYVAWWNAMELLGLEQHQCDVLMLRMNEKMLLTVPKAALHAVGKSYLKNMQKGARKRMQNPPAEIHEFDWDIQYRDRGNGSFDIDIFSCGFIAYTEKYGGRNMLPAICQVDYMISHYMNVGFERTGTLGAGCDKCDGKYCLKGQCGWDIEKRIAERK